MGVNRNIERWLPAALVAIALVRSLPYLFFTPDDYYIYLRFVQNVVEHGELSFNTGEPTYGFTSVFWLFVLVLGAEVSGQALMAGKILSLAATAAGPVLVYLIMKRLTAEAGLSFLAGLVWAGNAWMVRWSASGLESGLSASLALGVVLLAMRAREREAAPWAAAILAGVAPLVRPEMIGLTILFAAFWLWSGRGRHWLEAVLPPAVILAASLGALFLTFGRFFPNTAQAKGSMVDGLAKLVPSIAREVQILASTSAIELAIFGVAVLIWLSRGKWRELVARRDPQFVLLMVAWSVGVVLLYGVRGVTVYTRYLLIFMPFIVIGGFAPLAAWWRRGGRLQAVVLAVGALAIVQNSVLDVRIVRPATVAYQNSERSVNLVIAQWLVENSDPDDVVAVPDIGAIAYASRRKILDLNGLVTPELIPYKRDKQVNRFLEENPPAFIISIDPDAKWLESNGPDLNLEHVMSLPFEKMFIFQKGPLYYSLYRVLPAGSAPTDAFTRALR
jgi:hypothetical protein